MKGFIQKYIWLLGAAFVGILLGLDQWTKALAVHHLKDQEPFVIWDGVFEFRYFENSGAAWGMLKDKQIFFYILTVIFCAVILYEIHRLYRNPRYMPFVYTLFLVLSGAIGNFIDRVRLQYVVDFIYVKIINFPIFNLADCYITVSVVLLMLLLFFYYTDEEFEEMMPILVSKKHKEQE